MSGNTITVHRVLRSPPARIYRAFLDPDAMVKWLPPHGYTGKVHHSEVKVGGTYRMSFASLASGASHAFEGTYIELVQDQRICYTNQFDDPNLPGIMRTTITLKTVLCGSELTVVQEGIPEAIPTEMCYMGWQQSLVLLTCLVEADVPG